MKYKWDEEKSASFSCMMQTEHTQALMNEAISLITCDIKQALSKFNECFEHARECKKKKQYLLGMKKEKSGLTLNAGKVEKFSDNTCVSF